MKVRTRILAAVAASAALLAAGLVGGGATLADEVDATTSPMLGRVHVGSVDGAAGDPVSVDAHRGLLQTPAYEGGRTACRRCHLREYRSWQRTPHADAYETLPEENRADPECVKCHVTGSGAVGGFTSLEETPNLAGITCEVCHGPGSVYKDEEVMKSREASLAAGLLLPDEQTCLGCHNSESPNFPGSFNFEEMKEAGVHEIQREGDAQARR